MIKRLTPILLAGGIGKRLWPMSRKSFPKQFHHLFDKKTLFQNTLDRMKSSKDIIFNNPITVTNDNYRFLVLDQFKDLKRGYGEIFLEPVSKNTASAILSVSIHMFNSDRNSILLMSPTDHIMPNISAFHKLIKAGYEELEKGNMVIFGITPSSPETGYGYIETEIVKKNKACKINRFVEKPNSQNARKMLSSGNYLWNAGIILFRSKDLIDAFKIHQPDMLREVNSSLEKGKKDHEFFRLDKAHWNKCDNISIDHAILEKIKNLKVVPYNSKWSDLGDWNSIWKEKKQNNNNVVKSKNVTSINCKNVLLNNFSSRKHLVALGVENIIAISTNDAVLIANKTKSQEVKDVVDLMKEKNIPQGEIFYKDFRPWGWFEILSVSKFYKVKKILVYPNRCLSLQSHKYRSEHWVIIQGIANITIGEKNQICKKGESVYIPIGAIHRLENTHKNSLIIIETQTGTYLEEDDIIRYEDNYGRL